MIAGSFVANSFADPWPLGSVTPIGPFTVKCPAGHECFAINVSCPGIDSDVAYLAKKGSSPATTRGVVAFMSPAFGTAWLTSRYPDMASKIDELNAYGFDVVQTRWDSSWIYAPNGSEAGTAHMGCLPATLIKYIYDHYYVPLGISAPAPGQTGFAVQGSSGGSNQIAFALSHYGLDSIIDVALPTGGPTFGAEAKSCQSLAGQEPYQFDSSERKTVDRSFGFIGETGPCYLQDSNYIPRWLQESESTGGNDYYHPTTRVHFLLGGYDGKQRAIAGDYLQALTSAASPMLVWQIIPGIPHAILDYEEGRLALKSAIIGSVPPPPPPTPPLPPSNLAASASSSSQIDLSWTDASNNEDGFKIERSDDGINFSQVTTVPTNTITYSNTGLSASTTYYYRVRAYTTAGDSDYSNTANATTFVAPSLSPPTGLSASAASSTQINLSWIDTSNNEDGFKIERSGDGTNFNQITTVAANTITYSNTGLTASTTYYYRVRAYNSGGDSNYSNTANATTLGTSGAPSPPTGLSASAVSSNQINLSWTDTSSNETIFKIDRSTNGKNFTQIATVAANIVTYSSTGLSASTTYYYRVRAYNSGGNSSYSNTANATTFGVSSPPSPPTGLLASAVSSSQIDLSWSDTSNNEDGFKIELSSDGTNFSQITSVAANTTIYSNTGLSASTTYYYRVRAYNSGGNSSYSNTANATTSAPSPPSPPTGLSATAVSSSQINLSWTDTSNNEDGFKIELSDDGTNFSEITSVAADITTYSNTGLSASTKYYYRVRATNLAGDSAYSNTANDSTPAAPPPPSPPTGLSASAVSSSQMNLSWTDTSNSEDGFKIERSPDGTSFSQIASVAADTTTYPDNGLSASTTYYYRVRATNSSGDSAYSNDASDTTLDAPITLPLGTITINASTNCPTGWNCHYFQIQCPGGLQDINGYVADLPALSTPRGLAFFMPGGTGLGWYTNDNPEMVPVMDELRSQGFAIVEMRWTTSWIFVSNGVRAGAAHAACRPATMIKYVYENFYLPLGVPTPAPGVAGFAVLGSSGGSNQVGYALSHYGLDNIIDVAIPSGGPTFAVLAKGCLRNSGESAFWLDDTARAIVDRSFAFIANSGPCVAHDPSYTQRWLEESEATGGNDYYHPKTKVHFLLGISDDLQYTAQEYYQKLVDSGTPYKQFELVPAQHKITETQAGRDAVRNAISATTP